MNIKDAYELAAEEYRKKYDASGPRIDDVDQVFSYLDKQNPFILEIGCAYGRDAKYILTKTNQYIGIDITEKYIEMAKNEVPDGSFICTDVRDYNFPNSVDAIIAFASVLHLSKEELGSVITRAAAALNPGGVLFLSLKRSDEYGSGTETDELVSRKFYYYNRETLLELIPDELEEISYDEQERKVSWLTIVFKKRL